MKILIMTTTMFLLSSALALPLNYKFPVAKKGQLFSITSMEIVPSKVTEKIVTSKNAHGKFSTRKVPVAAMDKSNKGKAKALQYLTKVRSVILNSIKKNKFKGKSLIKLQIQKKGRFDVLMIQSKNIKLRDFLSQCISSIKQFAKIPHDLGQDELQLKIPIQFHAQ